MADTNFYGKLSKEKKALVPTRDYIDGHPLEEKIRRVCFKAGLREQGYDAAKAFNGELQKTMRTIVSKTYTDMFQTIRYTSNEVLTNDEREQHLDWAFEELEKYLKDTKKLISAHLKELQS